MVPKTISQTFFISENIEFQIFIYFKFKATFDSILIVVEARGVTRSRITRSREIKTRRDFSPR